VSDALLRVRDLHAYYGRSHVLQGVSFDVARSEIVAVLGRNGAGRSTALKAIMGDIPLRGEVVFKGQRIAGLKPHEVARLGLGYVPEERAIFPQLTVRQNLILGMKSRSQVGRWRIEDMFQIFPLLRERAETLGGVLSGGEQQMLTICRTLMGDPDLIMIDEPTEGLSPQMIERVGSLLLQIRERGVAVLLVEQKLVVALSISRRVYVMGHGRIVFEGTPTELTADHSVRREWLEL
jgi:branched-chain amino acid transport system ATP-binding protein